MNKAESLIAQMLTNRWAASTVVAGATVSAGSPTSVDRIQAQNRPYLDTLTWSIRNFVAGGGGAATMTVQLRHNSVAGTLIASFANLVGASTIASVQMTDLRYQGKRGGSLWVTSDTFVNSLTASVNAAGWIEDTNG